MPVREVSLKQFLEDTAAQLDDARYEPVAITESGARQFVVMSAEVFDSLRAGSRRALSTADLTDEQLGSPDAPPLPEGFSRLGEKPGGK